MYDDGESVYRSIVVSEIKSLRNSNVTKKRMTWTKLHIHTCKLGEFDGIQMQIWSFSDGFGVDWDGGCVGGAVVSGSSGG